MNIKLILPNNAVPIEPGAKVFFLAGPDLGGDHWWSEAIRLLERRVTNSYVICPKEHTIGNPVFQYVPRENDDVSKERSMKPFRDKAEWKRYYLDMAYARGIVILWMPAEDKSFPRPSEKGPYGIDVYGWLMDWREKSNGSGRNHIAVGGEDKFPDFPSIAASCRVKLGSDFPVYQTLQETVDAAVALANSE